MPKIYYQRGKDSGSRRIFIAVPTYSGSVGAAFLMSFFEAAQILDAARIGVDLCVQTGNCHVDDARNAMVREFLKTDCSDMVFVDEDVGFDGADLLKLVSVERDLVAGVYPCKQDEEEFPVRTKPGVELWAEPDGCVEVEGVPTGFLRMSRSMLETMISKFGDRKFHGRGQENEPPHVILFERTYENGVRYSGDYAFCRKWKSIGGQLYVMPEMSFTHTGEKSWGGCLGDFWRKKHGVTEARFDEAIARLRAGDAKPEYFQWLLDGWGNPYAATKEMLATIYELGKGATVLECGSGITTLVLACAGAKVVSLENDAGWMTRVYSHLQHYQLNADVRYSPITKYEGFEWYQRPEIGPVSLVVCDGPQRKYGRDGLFALMDDEIKSATIVMDDTDDSKQADLLGSWAKTNDMTIRDCGRFSICSKN